MSSETASAPSTANGATGEAPNRPLGRTADALSEPGRARSHDSEAAKTARRLGLRIRCARLSAALLGAPVAMIFYRTFEHGFAPVWNAVTQPNAMHAFWLSVELVAIVVPLNTVFGIGIALLDRARALSRQMAARTAAGPTLRHLSGGGGTLARARCMGAPAGSETG